MFEEIIMEMPTLLPENKYSYSDLEKSSYEYAQSLNSREAYNGRERIYAEPDINKFIKIFTRSVSENEEEPITLAKDLLDLYKIFLYDFHYPIWGRYKPSIPERCLAWSLSAVSAIAELSGKQQDLFVNNAAEKKARELYREYFPDLFKEDQTQHQMWPGSFCYNYKEAIHSILYCCCGRMSIEELGFTDLDLFKSILLITKYLYLSMNPDKYMKRGCEEAIKIFDSLTKQYVDGQEDDDL
jgi:hypothetical protein